MTVCPECGEWNDEGKCDYEPARDDVNGCAITTTCWNCGCKWEERYFEKTTIITPGLSAHNIPARAMT